MPYQFPYRNIEKLELMIPLPDAFSLQNKTILITGASSGIGRQCAISCEQKGAALILLGRDQERLIETMSLLNNKARHVTCSMDLCEYDTVETRMEEIIQKTGKINGLIHSAGISTTLPFKMMNPEKLEYFFQTNVFAAMNLTRFALKRTCISDEDGSVVFISSVMGLVGETGKSLYSMTKGALIAAVRSLSLEYGPRRIRFNCISPGVVETPMSKKSVYSQDEDTLSRIKSLHPLGIGQPDDIANACIYLLSDASKWVTGTNLIVDGGYTAR